MSGKFFPIKDLRARALQTLQAVILAIPYLRARTKETSSLPNDSMRPLFKQLETFSGIPTVYFNCKYFP